MTRGAIEARRDREVAIFTAALKIREILDQTQELFGAEYDAENVEGTILDLVTEEDPS